MIEDRVQILVIDLCDLFLELVARYGCSIKFNIIGIPSADFLLYLYIRKFNTLNHLILWWLLLTKLEKL